MLDHFFGFPQRVSPMDIDIFSERVNSVLPRYRMGGSSRRRTYGIEWRLLAAVSYQESHWNAGRTSPTGVRGIMQFTEDTAKLQR